MDERHPGGPGLFGAHSNYLFDRHADERQRLANQYRLLVDDFDLWFDQALRLGGLAADPVQAAWSALDLGAGEGQFAFRVAERYPNASVLGADVDAAAVEVAASRAPAVPNVRFAVHDARLPLPWGAGGFDVAIMWMVLMYLPDKRAVLGSLAAALRRGGVLLLCNTPEDPVRCSDPSITKLMRASLEMARRYGIVGIEASLPDDLEATGFRDVTTVELDYPLGGGTSSGQRWWAHLLATIAASRRAIVDAGGLMDGAEFDRRLDDLALEPVLRPCGTWSFLVTLARHP